jgi:hypothetical protein
MPYSPKHKRDTRKKILESTRRLFSFSLLLLQFRPYR